MRNLDELAELTQQLRRLRLQRQQLADEEERIINRLEGLTGEGTDPNNPSRTSPYNRGGYNRAQPRVITTPHRYEPNSHRYQVGDKVYITNRPRHTLADRAATVTRVTNRRVYFRTYSGQHTWRNPRNLRFLTTEEEVTLAD